jgi:membrane dipeptidase
MRYLVILFFVLLSCKQSTENKSETKNFEEIHDKAILVDGHNDFLMLLTDDLILDYSKNTIVFDQDLNGKTHLDLARFKEGGLDVQFFSVFCLGSQVNPFDMANRQIDSLEAIISRNPDKIMKAFNSMELLKAVKQKKSVAMIGVEGGHMIENDLSKLDSLFERGARYMTLTWNNSTPWATSANDETSNGNLKQKGLTDFGKQVVIRMNELGMLVDVSHVGEQTFRDVMQTTTKPIIASHSSVYQLCNHQRNLKDYQIKAIAKNNGVIQVNFNPPFIDKNFAKKSDAFLERHKKESDSLMKIFKDEWIVEYHLYHNYMDEVNEIRPPLSKLIEHIDYIVNLVGIDYVGLGSDFDGITITPQQLNDVTDFPLITKALLEKGYSSNDIDKILGGNILRVLKANESKK